MQRYRILCSSVAIVIVGTVISTFAQSSITTSDLERLQTEIRQATDDLTRLRTEDPELATPLQRQLDDLRDEAVYLKVKLRREGMVTPLEYAEVRGRVQALRVLARPSGTTPNVSQPRARNNADTAEVPVGTELDIRLQSPLNSGTAHVEDVIEATTIVDLSIAGSVLIPAGSRVRGIVESVNRATRTDRKGSVTVSFNRMTIDGHNYQIRATVTQALESDGIREEAGRIGTGAGVGAIIGGLFGGLKGAVVGILVGGGGTLAATEGKDVNLPAGTVLRIRLDTPLTLAR